MESVVFALLVYVSLIILPLDIYFQGIWTLVSLLLIVSFFRILVEVPIFFSWLVFGKKIGGDKLSNLKLTKVISNVAIFLVLLFFAIDSPGGEDIFTVLLVMYLPSLLVSVLLTKNGIFRSLRSNTGHL
ncbi:hypothetical protein [Microbulbifer sp. VVAC002]|uniref:hypothetical protein n=1 Tax=Microbulbifer sp. VVAC002 TaxID=3243387 RepID=UPI00403A1F96